MNKWDEYIVRKIANGFLVAPQSGMTFAISLEDTYYAKTEGDVADLIVELRKKENA